MAAADPSANASSELMIVPQTEGMMEREQLEDFLDDNVDEGRKERNRDNNNNNQQNINANNRNLSGNRPLFTTILVIYWLYYLVWLVVGIILTFYHWIGISEGITIVCMILPSLIMLILMSRVSCLNSLNINNINHYQNLNENAKQKYKLMSILITILLQFASLLRLIWWIYCIIQYVMEDRSIEMDTISSHRLTITLISLLVNEFGTILLLNIDYLKMSYFEKNKSKQGIFGIVYDPYPCLLSLSILITVQLWILTYGSIVYLDPDCDNDMSYRFIFECGLYIIYLITATITTIIPIAYLIKKFVIKSKQNNNRRS